MPWYPSGYYYLADPAATVTWHWVSGRKWMDGRIKLRILHLPISPTFNNQINIYLLSNTVYLTPGHAQLGQLCKTLQVNLLESGSNAVLTSLHLNLHTACFNTITLAHLTYYLYLKCPSPSVSPPVTIALHQLSLPSHNGRNASCHFSHYKHHLPLLNCVFPNSQMLELG